MSVNKPSYQYKHFLSTAGSKTTKLCKLLTRIAVPVIPSQRRLLFDSASTIDTLSVSWLSSTLWCAAAVCKESCKTHKSSLQSRDSHLTLRRTSWESLPKWKEVTEWWEKLHTEELHNLYSLPNVISFTPEGATGKACNMYCRYKIGTHIFSLKTHMNEQLCSKGFLSLGQGTTMTAP